MGQWGAWLEWVESKGAVVTPDALRSAKVAAHSSSGGFPAPAATVERHYPSPPPMPSAVPELPAQWEKVYSEEHRAHYYWDKATNNVQWDPPSSFAASAP